MPEAPGGAVGRGQDGSDWLLLEHREGHSLFVEYPVVSEAVVERDPDELEFVGRDEAAWRALMLRRRADEAVQAFGPTHSPAPKGSVRTAMVLCAGLGTRLRPLTNQYPKPALPFFGGPLVRYSFALLKGAGVERVVINTHHLPELMERTARQEAGRQGLELFVSHEPIIQGTAGGIRDARRHLDGGTFLLVNGDAFMSLDLLHLVAQHRASKAAATMAVTPMPVGEHFGAVETTTSGEVRRIGKPSGEGLLPWHFIGVHVLEPEVFDFIPGSGEQDINHVAYPAMIAAGRPVRACPMPLGAWGDMGTPSRYVAACQEVMSGLCDFAALGADAPISIDDSKRLRRAGMSGRVHVDPTAKVARNAYLERCQIGPGVEVGAKARLIDMAVLPGTSIGDGEVVMSGIASGELRLPS